MSSTNISLSTKHQADDYADVIVIIGVYVEKTSCTLLYPPREAGESRGWFLEYFLN